MTTSEKTKITVQVSVNVSMEKAWEAWVKPKHIINWNFASPDWQCPKSENDLQPGGNFVSRMEAKDGSFGFEFGGVYQDVIKHQLISYILEDSRTVKITFEEKDEEILVVETFEAESENPIELQRDGWQAIMNNYKKYVESLS
ncbi:SRPBCC family protein [Algoriphagus sp.]|uniref:SRPBCC family protein n=1 Tax=Algoriphagus sp. TaxID=1872435 RepID=UPI0025F43328|nr:SRPBCC family protein [Algoriphagus sp.]